MEVSKGKACAVPANTTSGPCVPNTLRDWGVTLASLSLSFPVCPTGCLGPAETVGWGQVWGFQVSCTSWDVRTSTLPGALCAPHLLEDKGGLLPVCSVVSSEPPDSEDLAWHAQPSPPGPASLVPEAPTPKPPLFSALPLGAFGLELWRQ